MEDVPRIIWVTTGELYADLQIAGEPLRIKISDIVAGHDLPDNPRTTAIYRHNDQYKYYAQGEWHTIATEGSVDSINLAVTELSSAVFDESTGINKLNENVDDLVELLSGDVGVISRLTSVEASVVDLDTALEASDAKIADIEKSLTYDDTIGIADLFSQVYNNESELNTTLNSHSSAISDIQSVNATQTADITNLQDRVRSLEESGGSNDPDYTPPTDLTDVTNRLDALDSSVETNSNDISELQGTVAGHTASISSVNTSLAEHSNSIASATAAINTLNNTTVPAITQRLDSLEASNGDSTPDNGSLEELENRLADVEDTLAEHASSINDTDKRIDSVHERIDENVEDIYQVIEDLGVPTIAMKLLDVDSDIDDLTSRVAAVESSVGSGSGSPSAEAFEALTNKVTTIETQSNAVEASVNTINNSTIPAITQRLTDLESQAVGIMFGIIVSGDKFQPIDITGDEPTLVGDPVDCNIYTFKTPTS